jgi:hypothetical protein
MKMGASEIFPAASVSLGQSLSILEEVRADEYPQ